jgi:predicted RNA-binding protein
MDTNELMCQELVELVTAYLENTLSTTDHNRFIAHLTLCKGCQHYLEQFRTTIRLTGKLTESHITPEAKQILLNEFRTWYQGDNTPNSLP